MDDPFSRMRDPVMRADRYQKVAVEYYDLAKEASSPSLRAYFQRVAEEYRVRAQGELRVLEHEGAAATARFETWRRRAAMRVEKPPGRPSLRCCCRSLAQSLQQAGRWRDATSGLR